jgi:hypothetical protein
MLISRTIPCEQYLPVYERCSFALPSAKVRRLGVVCIELSLGSATRCVG